MAGFWDTAKGVIGGGAFSKGFRNAASDFLSGTPEQNYQQSTLDPRQQKLKRQQVKSAMGPGAGGAYGSAADYYYQNLSDNPADLEAFMAPEMRRYNEQIIPDLAEQFAGMGAGNLSSSGFRNAAVSAGTDLSERLGALRANLRAQSAQGLQNIGGAALTPHMENINRPGTPGFLEQMAPAIGSAAGMFIGGPAGAAAGNAAGNWMSSFGKSSPYGGRSMSPYNPGY